MATQVRIDWPMVTCIVCQTAVPAKHVHLRNTALRDVAAATVFPAIERVMAPNDWQEVQVHSPSKPASSYLHVCPDCREELARRG